MGRPDSARADRPFAPPPPQVEYKLQIQLDEYHTFVTPPHMIIRVGVVERPSGKIVIPLMRTARGVWREALNWTSSGRLPDKWQILIERAYMQLLNREIVGDIRREE